MPPRWLTVLIVAFWLATSGWLFWRDLWPDWQPGQPPPYSIDLVEEAHRKDGKEPPKIFWNVTHGHESLSALTWVEHDEQDDTFELRAELKSQTVVAPARGVMVVKLRKLFSACRVTRGGRLLGYTVEARGGFGGVLERQLPLDLVVRVAGEVQDGQLLSHYRCDPPLGPLSEGDLPTVRVSHHGSVLLPLHPVSRIRGLRRGQSWRMPLVDPFPALAGPANGVRPLDARVLPQTEEVTWHGKPTACLVIEYSGKDMSGRTLVEEQSGRVLRQEANLDGDHWVMARD